MIALASDHVGLELKRMIMAYFDEKNILYKDYGTDSKDRVDYPVYARRAADAVVSGECSQGILFCGTGVGMSIAANKVAGIRCVNCSEPYSARLSRMHNDTNFLALGARVVGEDLAIMIVQEWLNGVYEAGRHAGRVEQLSRIERNESF